MKSYHNSKKINLQHPIEYFSKKVNIASNILAKKKTPDRDKENNTPSVSL